MWLIYSELAGVPHKIPHKTQLCQSHAAKRADEIGVYAWDFELKHEEMTNTRLWLRFLWRARHRCWFSLLISSLSLSSIRISLHILSLHSYDDNKLFFSSLPPVISVLFRLSLMCFISFFFRWLFSSRNWFRRKAGKWRAHVNYRNRWENEGHMLSIGLEHDK